MRKKRGFTIVEQAIAAVPAFADVKKRLEHQVELRGQSTSTLQNYIRRIALFVIHFGRLPVTQNRLHVVVLNTWCMGCATTTDC